MKKLSLAAFLLFLVCFITSCSIEKRVYGKGYYVEFNHNVTQEAKPIQEHVIKENDPIVIFPDEKVSAKNQGDKSKVSSQIKSGFITGEKKIIKTDRSTQPKANDSILPISNSIQKHSTAMHGEGQRPNVLACFSIICFILGFLLVPIVYLLGGLYIGVILLPILGFMALCFGIGGMIQIKKHPDYYKKKDVALVGMLGGAFELCTATVLWWLLGIFSALFN